MISLILKKVFFIFFLFYFSNHVFAKTETIILYKINDQIITNIDVSNEKKFLIFLNPNLKNLSNKQIANISKESLQNRKIKELELNKIFQLDKQELINDFMDNFITQMNYKSKEDLIQKLNSFDLSYNYFEKNLVIDNLWREFIFNKFKSQIKININELKKQIKSQKSDIEEFDLSEILYKEKPGISIDTISNQIYEEINKSGFEAAASLFSIAESKKFGGKLGWVKSNQISKEIFSEINKSKNITKPIKTKNGYLIIKINQKRITKEKINYELELNKLVNSETQKELNKLGYIYFNKIKKRTFISEK